MKAKPLKFDGDKTYTLCKPEEATHLELHTPGPFPTCIIPIQLVGIHNTAKTWTWNGDVDEPTIKPSIRTNDDNVMCHSMVTKGTIRFLSDCTHDLAGQTKDLLDVE